MKVSEINLMSSDGVALPVTHDAWMDVSSIFAGCLVMILAALVRVPVPGTDVPMTLQLLGVLLAGYALNPACAALSMVLYMVCGACGLPVFAGTGGLMGSTGGYIMGFVPAAYVVSLVSGSKSASVARMIGAGLCGMSIVFGMGVAWRVVLLPVFGVGQEHAGLAVATGIVPFVGKAVVELMLAVVCFRSVGHWRSGRRQSD